MSLPRQVDTIAASVHFSLGLGHLLVAAYHWIITGKKRYVALHGLVAAAEMKWTYDHIRDAGGGEG